MRTRGFGRGLLRIVCLILKVCTVYRGSDEPCKFEQQLPVGSKYFKVGVLIRRFACTTRDVCILRVH